MMHNPVGRLGGAIVMLVLVAAPAVAQRADSAGQARRHMRDASARMAAGDTAGAIGAVERATLAWPRQGAYLLSLARIAARGGRRDIAGAALTRAAAMGFAWSADDPVLASVTSGSPDIERAVATLRAPRIASTVAHVLRDSLLHVEGVAVDAATGRMFTSSVRLGVITVIDSAGGERTFAVEPDAIFGVVADASRGLLWATTSAAAERVGYAPADSNRAAIVAYDLASGRVWGRWELPRTSAHLLGDVFLAPDGDVWATDSRTPGIWRARLTDESGVAVRLPFDHPDFVSLQGIAFDRGGQFAWIADWTTGLFRLDIARGTVTAVDGDPALFTLGIDGLYQDGPRSLVAIQNGVAPTRVIRMHLGPARDRIERLEVLEHGMMPSGEPTLGVITGGALVYVSNAPWDAYGQAGALRAGAPLTRPVIRRLPL